MWYRCWLLLGLLGSVFAGDLTAQEVAPKWKVFILAGQSNMEGKGSIETMQRQLTDPEKRVRFQHLQGGEGWAERDDVRIHYLGNQGRRTGNLTVGYGKSNVGSQDVFGPELGFGWTVGQQLDNPVLIIKTAWGGKSLDRDFRPPSRGLPDSIDEVIKREQKRNQQLTRKEYEKGYGKYYRLMIGEVETVLGDLKRYAPEYAGQGYELAGMVWFQGWNDQYAPTSVQDYQDNMAAFIRDVRKDLNSPEMPVVIGAMGHNGVMQRGEIKQIADAQAAVAQQQEFRDSVITVRTADYWDTSADIAYQKHWADKEKRDVDQWKNYGNDHPYHYLGSPVFFYDVGVVFAQQLLLLDAARESAE